MYADDEDGGIIPQGKKRIFRYRTREGVTGEKERVVIRYRACMVCKLIATEEQFYDRGCPNCPFLEMQGSRQNVLDCTSPQFRGMLAVTRPEASWAARIVEVNRGVPACYAIQVIGELPERYADELAERLRPAADED